MQLGVERQEKLNRTQTPCGFSFRDCLGDYIAKNVGCHLLETKRNANLSKCKTIDEIRKFERTFNSLLRSTNKGIEKLTGCPPPCTYMKYSTLFSQRISPHFGFHLQFAVTELTVNKEVIDV